VKFFLWRLKNIIFRFVRLNKQLPSHYLELGWTREALARTASGRATAPSATNAVSWCFLGAVDKAFSSNGGIRELFRESARNLMSPNSHRINADIIHWNDSPSQTQEEVVAFARLVERKAGLR